MSDQTVILGELAEEFSARVRNGELPDINEYVEKYPELSHRIRDLFPTLMILEGMATGNGNLSRSTATLALSSGDVFGNYRIESEIGRGGMGVVYQAVHQALYKQVALKILVLGSNPVSNNLERFLREARTAAKLHHTNIVPVFDVGQAEGVAYYAMPLVEGTPLNELLADTNTTNICSFDREAKTVAPGSDLDVEKANTTKEANVGDSKPPADYKTWHEYFRFVSNIGAQVADGLQYAHVNHIIHRDIKPSNLIIDHNKNVWITDFGLSRHVDDPSLTHTGMVIGTPRYMSPEQAGAASKPIDHRTDIYSLGASLYELVAQRPPFDAGTPVEIVMAILDRQPVPLRKLNPHVPRDLETIIQKAMAKSVDDRYQSADAMASDLRLWSAGETISARRPSVSERLVRWSRRNPRIAALMGAVAALLVTIVVGSVIFAINSEKAARTADQLRSKADAAKNTAQKRLLEAREHQARSDINLSNTLLEQAKSEQLLGKNGYRKRSINNVRRAWEIVSKLDSDTLSRLDAKPDSRVFAIPSQVELRSELLNCLQSLDLEEIQRFSGAVTSVSANGKWTLHSDAPRRSNAGGLQSSLHLMNNENDKSFRVEVNSMLLGAAVNSTGDQAVICKPKFEIVLIDTRSGDLIRVLDLPDQPESADSRIHYAIQNIQFTEDDRFVVGVFSEDLMAVWDLQNSKFFWIESPGFPGPNQIVYLAKEQNFLMAGEKALMFYSAKTGELDKKLELDGDSLLGALAISEGQERAAVVTVAENAPAKLSLINLKSKKQIATQQLGMQVPLEIEFGPASRQLAVGMGDGQLQLFSVKDLSLLASCKASDFGILDIVFSESDDSLFVKSIADISKWKLIEESPVVHLKSKTTTTGYFHAVLHPVTKTLVSAARDVIQMGFPDLTSNKSIPIDRVRFLEVSHHAPICAVSDRSRRDLKILDLAENKIVKQWNHPEKSFIHSVGFAEDDDILAITGARRGGTTFEVFNIRSNEMVWTYELTGNLTLQSATIAPDGKHIGIVGNGPATKSNFLSSPDSTIIVVQIGKKEPVFRWETETDIQRVGFSEDGRLVFGIPSNQYWILSRSMQNAKKIENSSVPVADLSSGNKERLEIPTRVVDVELSPDGRLLAARDIKGLIRFWQLSTFLKDGDDDNRDAHVMPTFNWLPSDRGRSSKRFESSGAPGLAMMDLNLQVFFGPESRFVFANNLMGGHYRLDLEKLDRELGRLEFETAESKSRKSVQE